MTAPARTAPQHRRLANQRLAGLAGLSPAYFAMVMATGVVSLAAFQQGLELVARALFGLNVVSWLLLSLLNGIRLLRYPRAFFGDMVDHLRGPGFFTSVAATALLGTQFVMLVGGGERIAFALWLLALVLWAGLTYTIFTAFTIKEVKPTLDKGISGAWLLAVVATQSLAVLSALLAAHTPQPWRLELNFFALSMWLWGGMLYIWMMSLIFYRYTFFHFSPDDLTPPYWINMGAMAISTLAGSLLIMNAPDAPFLQSLVPFLKGFTVFYWATGTWWVPMLLVLGVWRYVYKRFPFEYDPLYWGAVFPLGMYSACTFRMAQAMSFGFLSALSSAFLAAALAAWALTFAGLLFQLARRLRGVNRRP
ncbi:tellurite resistance/C4-dicarboxylate transporter family protein [Polaromonas sp. C04]|uniref:tellurite resistance/C4-dicarboxylate transporter family protein n=1 Tax=Polaromonas sp. C04 TaxID=1945857 RepID=UPI000984AFA9|nr:tellurite resistance/C4-dicarboxylate transporter family protein [Polaromonas sp. C04]OOG50803.1 C4-dicarboxylate ABC transporter [Polaromonas sp. C04]